MAVRSDSALQAPAAFETPTMIQNPGSQSVSNGVAEPPGDTFAVDQSHFEEEEGLDTGVGPVYNARSCVDCHQNPVTGGVSQVTELRAGHFDRHGNFVNPTVVINDGQTTIANRSLINDRAVCPQAQELLPPSENVRTFRLSLNTLGDGFVEAIADTTLQAIAQQEPRLSQGNIAGEYIEVPILEAPGQTRIGRFGWKDQHGSLLSFASDAYINEQGITNRLSPTDTTSVCKTTADPEDVPDSIGMADIDHFCAIHPGDSGAASRRYDHGNSQCSSRAATVLTDRVRYLPCLLDYHRSSGHGDERRDLHCTGRAGEYGHPAIQ